MFRPHEVSVEQVFPVHSKLLEAHMSFSLSPLNGDYIGGYKRGY